MHHFLWGCEESQLSRVLQLSVSGAGGAAQSQGGVCIPHTPSKFVTDNHEMGGGQLAEIDIFLDEWPFFEAAYRRSELQLHSGV